MACIDATELIAPLFEIYTLEEVDEWLHSPHKLLGGETATALIASGRQDEVKAVIDQLISGAYT
jgi:hypothetical protein